MVTNRQYTGRAARTSTHPVMTSTGLSALSAGQSPLTKTPDTPQCIFDFVLTSITLAQH